MSLKTKLRLSILAMVMAVVLAYSWLYVSLLTRKEIEATIVLGQFIDREIAQRANQALEEAKIARPDLLNASSDAVTIRLTTRLALQGNAGVNSLIESIPSFSYPMVYAEVVGDDNIILAHSDSTQLNAAAPLRNPFEPLLNSGVLEQLRVVFGPEQTFEIGSTLDLNIGDKSLPFATVRVGISTVLLGNVLKPQLKDAATLVSVALALALVLGWVGITVLLRPLEKINVSLDLMTKGQFDAVPAVAARPDEFGAVASKLSLLGQQFRDVRGSMAQLLYGLEEALMLFTRDGRAILAREKVRDFLNLAPGEILGRRVEDVFASQPDLAMMVSQAIRQGLPFQRREVELAEGRRATLSVQFIAGLPAEGATEETSGRRNGSGSVALVSLRDAESMRRLESQIEMSHRLAAISPLTSGVAHEVRNPLNAIVLHLEALKAKLKSAGEEGGKEGIDEHLDVIGREIYRLDRVVRTFLDFQRPVSLNLQETDLNALVHEVVALASAEADTRKVHMVFDENGVRPRVRVDRDLIKQAILNVVLNGCQAMPEGGELSLREEISDGVVELAVADQGPGIGPEIQEKIFDLYFTTRERGSGIGLPLAFRAFQLHNGTVEFDNRTEGGAVFRLRLPLASPAPALPGRAA